MSRKGQGWPGLLFFQAQQKGGAPAQWRGDACNVGISTRHNRRGWRAGGRARGTPPARGSGPQPRASPGEGRGGGSRPQPRGQRWPGRLPGRAGRAHAAPSVSRRRPGGRGAAQHAARPGPLGPESRKGPPAPAPALAPARPAGEGWVLGGAAAAGGVGEGPQSEGMAWAGGRARGARPWPPKGETNECFKGALERGEAGPPLRSAAAGVYLMSGGGAAAGGARAEGAGHEVWGRAWRLGRSSCRGPFSARRRGRAGCAAGGMIAPAAAAAAAAPHGRCRAGAPPPPGPPTPPATHPRS
jgi:hypothetical protein